MSKTNEILGFTLIELPQTGITPFQLLHKHDNNKVEKICKLNELFPRNNISLPTIGKRKTPNNISDKFSLNIDVQAKAELFSRLYSNLAGADFSANINTEDELMIIAENAVIKEVKSLNQLNNYINDAKLTADLSNYEKPLKKGNIFVITSILTCKKFAITLADRNSFGIGAKAQIKDIASLKASVDMLKLKEKLIVHSGEEDLVIGFKAHKLKYEKKFWQLKDKARYSLIPADHIGVLSDENLPVEALTSPSGSVMFIDEAIK